jgi:hypothetical protein
MGRGRIARGNRLLQITVPVDILWRLGQFAEQKRLTKSSVAIIALTDAFEKYGVPEMPGEVDPNQVLLDLEAAGTIKCS